MKRERSLIVLCGMLCAAFAPVRVYGQGPITPVAASAARLSFDQPLAWLKDAKAGFSAVKDYSCVLTTRENMNGKIGDQNVIQLEMLTQPFCVHMKWLAPKKSEGQEVFFVKGKNNDKMRVKTPIKILGFVSIDVNDPRVLQNSRHTILEAGIGNMIDDLLKIGELERALGKSMVKAPVAAKMNGRDCIKLEIVRLEHDKKLPCHRTIVYLDKESKMPIRLENYDWPRAGGPADGELLEEFSYRRITWNAGLKEAQFSK